MKIGHVAERLLAGSHQQDAPIETPRQALGKSSSFLEACSLIDLYELLDLVKDDQR